MLNWAEIFKRNRVTEVALQRHIVFHILRNKHGMRLKDICEIFKSHDHATVVYGCKRVDMRLSSIKFKSYYDKILSLLNDLALKGIALGPELDTGEIEYFEISGKNYVYKNQESDLMQAIVEGRKEARRKLKRGEIPLWLRKINEDKVFNLKYNQVFYELQRGY